MEKAKEMTFPCLLHMPDQGSFDISCNVDKHFLHYDARRNVKKNFVSIGFPPANAENRIIKYPIKSKIIYPDSTIYRNDKRYDNLRMNFINMFQMNPRLRILANNSSSDNWAFTLYEYAMVAEKTPPLAKGLTEMDLVRLSIGRYLDGAKGYCLVGFTDKDEDADTIA